MGHLKIEAPFLQVEFETCYITGHATPFHRQGNEIRQSVTKENSLTLVRMN